MYTNLLPNLIIHTLTISIMKSYKIQLPNNARRGIQMKAVHTITNYELNHANLYVPALQQEQLQDREGLAAAPEHERAMSQHAEFHAWHSYHRPRECHLE